MKVAIEHRGHVLELRRTLGGISFVVNGEVRGMSGGKLIYHKIDQSYEAEILEGHDQGVKVKAELKLGWVTDQVLFYYNDELIAQKKIF